MQQVAYIISTDGKLTQNDIDEINNLMPLEKWRELYDPTEISLNYFPYDYIKFSGDFDREYMVNITVRRSRLSGEDGAILPVTQSQ